MAVTTILFSCNLFTKQDESAVPGTYVRQFENKQGKIYDTVIISAVSASAHQYLVEQRMALKRKGGAKPSFKDRSVNKYASFYNGETRVLEIPELMAALSFTDDGRLVYGNVEYKKTK
jgi:hypothetical protein